MALLLQGELVSHDFFILNFPSVPNVRRWTNTFQFSAKCRKHVAVLRARSRAGFGTHRPLHPLVKLSN